jgi:hypothetical protein
MSAFAILSAAIIVSGPQAIEPSSSSEKVAWGKNAAYVAGADGVAFTVDGPKSVMLELWGEKPGPHEIHVVRDDMAISKNAIKMKPAKKGPAGYGASAALGFEVPAGKHVYKVSAPGKKVAITANVPAKKLAKNQMMAAEVALSSAAAAAPATPVEAAPVEEAPATAAAAEPAPAATPSVTEISAAPAAMVAASMGDAGGSGNVQVAKRVAVYEMGMQEIPPNVAKVVTDSILAEVRKLQGISAIGMDEIQDMLSHEASKQMVGCESNESCLAEIAGALGVDDLVTGSLSKVGENSVMVLRRIDQRRAKVMGTINKRLVAGSGEEFLAAIGPAIEELFPERQLREGAERGVPKEMALRLNPPPLPAWSFYTVAGGAVVAAAVGGVFGLLAKQSETDANQYAASGVDAPISGATLVEKQNTAESQAFNANVAYGSAGGLALTAVIMFLFTDFEGIGEEAAK